MILTGCLCLTQSDIPLTSTFSIQILFVGKANRVLRQTFAWNRLTVKEPIKGKSELEESFKDLTQDIERGVEEITKYEATKGSSVENTLASIVQSINQH